MSLQDPAVPPTSMTGPCVGDGGRGAGMGKAGEPPAPPPPRAFQARGAPVTETEPPAGSKCGFSGPLLLLSNHNPQHLLPRMPALVLGQVQTLSRASADSVSDVLTACS